MDDTPKEKWLQDLLEKLEKRGVKPGQFFHQSGGQFEHPSVKDQKKSLSVISAMLEEQVKKDKALVEELHQKINQLKHGGTGKAP
jgi:hypothetical protein